MKLVLARHSELPQEVESLLALSFTSLHFSQGRKASSSSTNNKKAMC